ncbi:hypothetical protein JXQ70_02345 [bacterium]|nr:hypothetical protein [bacterium]
MSVKQGDFVRRDQLLMMAHEYFDQVESSFFATLGILGKAMIHELQGEEVREIDELLGPIANTLIAKL